MGCGADLTFFDSSDSDLVDYDYIDSGTWRDVVMNNYGVVTSYISLARKRC